MRRLEAVSLEQGTWEYLELLTDPDGLRRRISDKRVAIQVCRCIAQAKEYYEAARHVSVLTKPLLLYYGMLNLSKALIGVVDPSIAFPTNETHGLTRRRLPRAKGTSRAGQHILRMGCRVQSAKHSVFGNLLAVAKVDRHLIKVRVNGVEILRAEECGYDDQFKCSGGQEYSLADVLRLIPELFDFLLEASTLLPRVVPVNGFIYDTETDANGYPKWYRGCRLVLRHGNDQRIKNLLVSQEKTALLSDWPERTDQWDVRIYSIPGKVERFRLPSMRESIFGRPFAVFETGRKPDLSEIPLHYVAMFILSDLVRYDPEAWLNALERRPADRLVIDRFLAVSQAKFPLLVLREMRQEYVSFHPLGAEME